MFTQNALVAETERLQKFALRLTRNKQNADDLLQSTCLRALEKSDYFQEGSNLFSWTSKIMYHIFVSDYRRKVRFETQYDPEPYLEKQSVLPQQDTNMELADVQRAMNSLTSEHRTILNVICIEGSNYQEASEILNIPVGTVRSRLSRARSSLQCILDTPCLTSTELTKINTSAIYSYHNSL
jgi:RNA polymerase sigma-70 factor, ECF subfamily